MVFERKLSYKVPSPGIYEDSRTLSDGAPAPGGEVLARAPPPPKWLYFTGGSKTHKMAFLRG